MPTLFDGKCANVHMRPVNPRNFTVGFLSMDPWIFVFPSKINPRSKKNPRETTLPKNGSHMSKRSATYKVPYAGPS